MSDKSGKPELGMVMSGGRIPEWGMEQEEKKVRDCLCNDSAQLRVNFFGWHRLLAVNANPFYRFFMKPSPIIAGTYPSPKSNRGVAKKTFSSGNSISGGTVAASSANTSR